MLAATVGRMEFIAPHNSATAVVLVVTAIELWPVKCLMYCQHIALIIPLQGRTETGTHR
jgi:hypothetical protein